MAQSSKTFAGSALTPTGDAAVSGNSLTVAAVASHDTNAAVLGALADGTAVADWTTVLGSGSSVTFTKQTNGGEPVARINTNGWAGAYGPSVAENGCFVAVAKAAGGRFTLVPRYSTGAARGYPTQVISPNSFDLYTSCPTNFLGLNTPARVSAIYTLPALPWTGKVNTFTRTDTNVQVTYKLNDKVVYDLLDSYSKWPAGRIAVQALVGITDFTRLAYFPTRTGGFTATFTPLSVTSLTRIVVEWDNEACSRKKTSEVFEYQIDGGAWVALPDSGYINAACTSTIGLRSNSLLVNDADASLAVNVNSVAVEIAGQWDAYVPPSVNAPTSLAAGTPTSSSIPLTWTDAASPSAFVDVYMATSELGSYSLVEVATQGDQAVTVYGLSASTAYWFKLKARSAEGATSSFTAAVTATTEPLVTVPAAPTLSRA